MSLKQALEKCKKVLTEDEIVAVLTRVTTAREAKLREDAYWDEIRKPVTFKRYDYTSMRQWFLAMYEKINGKSFELDTYTEPVIHALCLYFSEDERFEKLDSSFSLKKGIFIQGNVGCGKTSVLKTFAENQKQSYISVSCPDLARDFSTSGYNGFKKYTTRNPNTHQSTRYFGQEFLTWFFDDLGFEAYGKHYGKASNIMQEIMQGIYDNMELRGKVHFTTNLSADEISDHYGSRIRSRLREMCNIIQYDGDAPDRRI